MAEIVNIQSLDAVTFELQTYTLNDINLIKEQLANLEKIIG